MPSVKYFSVSACLPRRGMPAFAIHSHKIIYEAEGPNDGLVSVESANAFGRPLPSWPVDHLRQMNWLAPPEHSPVERQPLELHAEIIEHLASLGFGTSMQPAETPPLEAAPALAPCPQAADRVK